MRGTINQNDFSKSIRNKWNKRLEKQTTNENTFHSIRISVMAANV